MRNANSYFKFFSKAIPVLLFFCTWNTLQLSGQGAYYPYEGTYRDYIIPQTSKKYLVITAVGGGGGVGAKTGIDFRTPISAGEGAFVQACFEIGTAGNQLKPGSTLRLMVGGKGANLDVFGGNLGTFGAGGGGGTGIVYRDATTNDWKLLMVAAGGGGSGWSLLNGTLSGISGQGYLSGNEGSGKGGSSGGTNKDKAGGGSGAFGDDEFFAGLKLNGDEDNKYGYHAKAGWSGGPLSGEPTGGSCVGGGSPGAWGFGAGGNGDKVAAYTGGGGGYTGGDYCGGEDRSSANPATSYVNEVLADSYFSLNGGRSTNTQPGDVTIMFTDFDPIGNAIKFAYNTNKCIDDYGSNTANGTNIQTYPCTGNPNQKWFFHPTDRSIRSLLNSEKCIDLSSSNTNNGANIQLWDCNGSDAQHWVYNGLFKTIHSSVNSGKCWDAANGSASTANVNLQLWDCQYTNNNQKWEIDGATTVSNPANVKHIIPVLAPNFAVASALGNVSGSNIQLWTKDASLSSENWYFDGWAIKLRDHQELCIDLHDSNTDNGNNIQLWGCNGTNAQKWLYDGMTKAIRSVINPGKCMQIELNADPAYGKRSNIDIQDCNGSAAQQFLIQE